MTDKIPVYIHAAQPVWRDALWPAVGGFIDPADIRYRIDPKTGEPLRIYGNLAVILNDDGSTINEHWDEEGRLYMTSYRTVPYPKDWKAT
jgi:hypothetical protein